ncbi:MAG TPA: peptidase S1 [Gemmataceae bacterium]|nr:peptidase S1 [Gemmataceae bacterium]
MGTLKLKEQGYIDTTAYGSGPTDSVIDRTENAAVTRHRLELGGKSIPYTAAAGHLVTVDPDTSQPAAKIFYVAYLADGADETNRPVTFFYNGGPGSSAVFVMLGSFGPVRIKDCLPAFTPAPYTLEDNSDSLLDKSDLVFINPVGTGYSAAIAPRQNKDFWGVDQDAASLAQFIIRFLTVYRRWNSPKFLYGESYGTARTAVLAWLLHEDGIDLNGVVLQSSILDYSDSNNDPVGLLPTLAANAYYHNRIRVAPKPATLEAFLNEMVLPFADKDYAAAVNAITIPTPKPLPEWSAVVKTIETLSSYLGISPVVVTTWGLGAGMGNSFGTLFLLALLSDEGLALGAYDGRVTGIDTGIAAMISPLSGANDPTIAAINGVYTATWNRYLNEVLQFTALSSFTSLNNQAFLNWDFRHIDPTGAQKGTENLNVRQYLYTAGDLAAAMAVNVNLKVLSLNGYFDSVTPFYQTAGDLKNMPLLDADIRKHNLTIRNYPSGHMIYLDDKSRTAMKADLAAFYDSAFDAAPMRHNYRWLPPRVDGLPREHQLWVYDAGVVARSGAIPSRRKEPSLRPTANGD